MKKLSICVLVVTLAMSSNAFLTNTTYGASSTFTNSTTTQTIPYTNSIHGYKTGVKEYAQKAPNMENVLDFARAISMLSVDTPISIAYDRDFGQRDNRWWTSQREHLTVWCLHQPTTGVPGFRHKPNWSSRIMYNRFGRPETLLWLAEALGEDTNKLTRIATDISQMRRLDACNHFRREIPFDRIKELLIPKLEE